MIHSPVAVQLSRPGTGEPHVPVPGSLDEALRTVGTWPGDLRPGRGITVRLWEVLATLAASDLAVARAVEPHLDALAILDQARAALPADLSAPTTTWGVFAAEGPGVRLDAHQTATGWVLDGVKPWCSLAGRLDAALVTAHLPEGGRSLFAVRLSDRGVTVLDEPWASRGLAEIASTGVQFSGVPALAVGEPGWYLTRPGFWWGAIGVAACWHGGAVAVARRVFEEAARKPDDRLLAMHLGAIDERLESSRLVLTHAALVVDAAAAGAAVPDGNVLAKRVRATVARTCEDVLRTAAHALGPGPLAMEPAHAKHVADLEIYVRQHHAERDDASLGSALVGRGSMPW